MSVLLESLEKAKDDNDILQSIIDQFMPLILKAAKYYSPPNFYSDSVSEGTVAFINCVKKYPLDSNIPFPHYAKKAVYSHIKDFIKREIYKSENTISISTPYAGGEDITIEETLSSNINIEKDYLENDLLKSIINHIDTLSDIEKEVLKRHFFLGHSLKKVSEDTGYSYRGVKYAKSRGIKSIKDKFQK